MANKLYVTGDIHGEIEIMDRFSTRNFPEGAKLDKSDIIVVMGDFGLIWDGTPSKREEYHLKWLQNRAWTTVFIDGNHENHPRLQALPIEQKFDGHVGVVREGIYYLRRGEVYNLNGKKVFCFGGALSWDKENRKEFISWWEEEIPNYEEMEHALDTLEEHQWKFDYIFTHTMPLRIVDKVGLKGGKKDTTCDFLEHLAESPLEFDTWFSGHFHVDQSFGKFRILYYDIIDIDTRESIN
tara:strand:- start:64137 stop:64853 length:717 start_codon:yes stop_codon:yes gene_type:complete